MPAPHPQGPSDEYREQEPDSVILGMDCRSQATRKVELNQFPA